MSAFEPRLKLTNPGRDVVRESLEGLVDCNPGLRLLERDNTVIRYDYRQHVAAGKVCVVSGGGSGHEPAFCGLVASGLLTAAVAGQVFRSPPASQVLNVLRKLAYAASLAADDEDPDAANTRIDSSRPHLHTSETLFDGGFNNNNHPCVAGLGGILIVIMNYTGDRLNFGLAVERFCIELGSRDRVRLVVVGEDVALSADAGGAGRRGLAGTIALLKVAGAMAESGKSLQEITSTLESLRDQVATVGVSLGSVSVPGDKSNLFELPLGKMELGMGIHGEAGVQRVDAGSCEEIVGRVGRLLLRGWRSAMTQWSPDNKAVVIVNNLGGLTMLEMGVICKNALQFFDQEEIDVVRLYSGCFLSSLDMAGFSLTLLKPGIGTLHWLDEPTSAPAWLVPYVTRRCLDRRDSPRLSLPPPATSAGTAADALVADGARHQRRSGRLRDADASGVDAAARAALHALIAERSALDRLDAVCGDGDCGACLEAGAQAILRVLDESRDGGGMLLRYPADAFAKFAVATESEMGGTSGAVYSLILNAIAAELFDAAPVSDGDEIEVSTRLAARCMRAATEKVIDYGGASKGDRTMVDVLLAVTESLEAGDSCALVASAAERAAASTAAMRARRGRAAYVDSALTLGRPDAGAHAVAVWVAAICGAACSYNQTRV